MFRCGGVLAGKEAKMETKMSYMWFVNTQMFKKKIKKIKKKANKEKKMIKKKKKREK